MSERMDQPPNRSDSGEERQDEHLAAEAQIDYRKNILSQVVFTDAWHQQHRRREALLKGSRR